MNANANAPMNAFFGPAFQDLEPMLYSDPYEKMLLIAATEPEESRNTCTRWWIEDLIAAQIRAEERGRVCGEDAQVVEPYVAWLSDEQLREIDELEVCCQTKAHAEPRGDVHGPDSETERRTTSASTSSSSSSSTSTSPSSSAPTSEIDASQTREKGRPDGMADAWLFQAERAMDVWSEVLGVMIDHAHGISQEERAQRCEPYADWTLGPSPPFTDYGAVFC